MRENEPRGGNMAGPPAPFWRRYMKELAIGFAVLAVLLTGVGVSGWAAYYGWQQIQAQRRLRPPRPTQHTHTAQPGAPGAGQRQEPAQVTEDDAFGPRRIYRTFATWRSADTETVAMFRRRDYAALEARARELRRKQARDSDGQWLLRYFYESVTMPNQESERAYEMFKERLDEWEQAYPNSVTASLAQAGWCNNYAWYARGSGWGNTVTPAGRQDLQQRVAAAEMYIAQARQCADTCPELYQTLHVIALGHDWTRDQYLAMFAEAVATAPEYTDIYLSCAYALLPRWKGISADDWEQMASDQADRIGGAAGDELYARIATHIFGYESDIFSSQVASWDRTRSGYEEILRRYPKARWQLNAYGVLACVNRDQATAQKVFALLGDRKYPSVWLNDGFFLNAREWANGTRPNLPVYPGLTEGE